MKNKFFAILLSVTFAVSLCVSVFAAGTIPESRQRPLLVDDAELLTDGEEQTLNEKLEEISARNKTDVAIVTVRSLQGASPMEFADDFYDYNGYGQGEERDGVLLLLSMEERDWWLTTTGYGITAVTDEARDYIMNEEGVLFCFGAEDYYGGFTIFAEKCDEYISLAKAGTPFVPDYDAEYGDGYYSYEVDNYVPLNNYHSGGASLPNYIFAAVIALALGFLIAFIVMKSVASNLKTVAKKASANDYLVNGSLKITKSSDIYLYSNIAKTPRPQSDSPSGSNMHGGSGGSSIHVSSSGTSHGGGGGKF